MAICGLTEGLDPPAAGWAWQPEQEFKLYPGPRPVLTDSTSLNVVLKLLNAANSTEVSPEIGPPAPGGPLRTPGSVCAQLVPASTNALIAVTNMLFMREISPVGMWRENFRSGMKRREKR